MLYTKVRDYVRTALERQGKAYVGTLYDLYSGTGTIAQLMAGVADRVMGVEIVEEAVKAAEENAVQNGLTNCDFIAGDVLKVLEDRVAATTSPDIIILDPPRDGVHPKALLRIASYGVKAMVYVSCKPASLLKDLPVLKEAGYRIIKSCALDQFPWTRNTEAILLLEKKD